MHYIFESDSPSTWAVYRIENEAAIVHRKGLSYKQAEQLTSELNNRLLDHAARWRTNPLRDFPAERAATYA